MSEINKTGNANMQEYSELWRKLNAGGLTDNDYIYLKQRVGDLLSEGAKRLENNPHDFMQGYKGTTGYISLTN